MGDRRGFGIVQALIGAVLLGMVAMGVSRLSSTFNKAVGRDRYVSTMLALDASLKAALQDSSNFTAIKADLLDAVTTKVASEVVVGAVASPASIDFAPYGQVIARPGTPKHFNQKGETCAPFGSGDCLIELRLDIRKAAGSTQFRYAYQIKAALKSPNMPIPSLGAPDRASPTFLDADYSPLKLGFSSSPSDCGADGIVRGVDVGSKLVSCWKVLSTSCPPGSWGRGLIFKDIANPPDRFTGTVETFCETPLNPECPTHYALSQVNLFQMAVSGASAASVPAANRTTCTYAGIDTMPKQGFNCPVDYNQDATWTNCTVGVAKTAFPTTWSH